MYKVRCLDFMIVIKDSQTLKNMAVAGRLLAELFEQLPIIIQPSRSTLDIDRFIGEYLLKYSLISGSRGYKGYRHVSCVSLNDEVVHGIPQERRRVKMGDLVKVDVCASYNGGFADMARCFFIGEPSPEDKKFIEAAYVALESGIEKIVIGNHIGDISAAIESIALKNGYGVVREFAGHGIGKNMHEEPEVLNYGMPGTGALIRPGMALALEPILTKKSSKIYIAHDGWTVKTVDKSLAAHVEDTVVVTEQGPEIITRVK